MFDVIIVGGGASGIGCAVVLQALGVRKMVVLERTRVGASFERWPEGMRFITPSFTSNQFGSLDLNAIALQTSPAFTLRQEHPTGPDFARYVRSVARTFDVPVRTGVDVVAIDRRNGPFQVQTNRKTLRARFVIWAAGEFQFPHRAAFPGAEHCRHNADVRTWQGVDGDEVCVIGGYESGIDAAVSLVGTGKRVVVLDRKRRWDEQSSDPSEILSPFTQDRLRLALATGRLRTIGGVTIARVDPARGGYTVVATSGARWTTSGAPVLATGFRSAASGIADRFAWTPDGFAQLTGQDESTITPGLFLVGPSVRHDNVVFCFVYKFRQRFAVVAHAIGERLGLDLAPLDVYRANGMFLDDLSCCGEQCAC